MRYKYYQIQGYDVEDDPESFWLDLPSVTVTSDAPLFGPRVVYNKLGPYWRSNPNSKHYDFLQVSDYLYRRVDKGKNIDTIHGHQCTYIRILPETHPGYNFDIYYRFCCTGYVPPLDDFYNDEDLTSIVVNTFPDFVAANKTK